MIPVNTNPVAYTMALFIAALAVAAWGFLAGLVAGRGK